MKNAEIKQAKIKVAMADMQWGEGGDTLTTSGLGSCVGIVIYSLRHQYACLIHAMLPSSSMAREGQHINEAKYTDAALQKAFAGFEGRHIPIASLEAKLAGGARMFQFQTDHLHIGKRNVEAAKEMLAGRSVPLKAEETGGHIGRTIEFDVATGVLRIKPTGGEPIII
ncbi:chemotaxis protein CheD [Marinococcus luteus]|uniref:chemotaxis protein CheD n=1 Tax=Marinococcus luteus TaxID=1122204 RepID=UPI002ACCDA4E|nr:chemotaxis protein CheD [Marinococcus luteus]MDZ5781831.1 chemotaxis protein CheD [Marinococcus luteus]